MGTSREEEPQEFGRLRGPESSKDKQDGLALYEKPESEKLIAGQYRLKIRGTVKSSLQGKVYNFLERPTGWKCFIYHFTV